MATETTNLHLVKPAQSEKYNVDVFNGNADILDNAYANMSSEMSQQNTDLQNLINERITDHNSLRTSLDDTNTVHPYIQAKIQDNTSAIEVLQQEIADIEAGQVEGVQSDWLQNNTSKINYIKNKPFYDEYLTNDIIPYSIINWDGEPVESEGSYTRTATYTVSTPMVANTDYLITINGSEYKFTTPSEEPFEYSFVEGDYIYSIAQSGTTITFTEISTSAETMANLFGLGIISQVITHQIDEKYMPDYYSILKQRCDTNAVDKMGVVPAPTASKARYFYSTDSNGSPAWRNNITVVGATSTADGTAGLVPAPSAGDQTKFLKGNGTWAEPTNTWVANTVTTAGYVAAPTASRANYFYSTNDDGTPAWRNNVIADRTKPGLMSSGTYRTLFNYASASDTSRTHTERMFWGISANGTPGWYNYTATVSAPGWMSESDKSKLDGVASGATVSGFAIGTEDGETKNGISAGSTTIASGWNTSSPKVLTKMRVTEPGTYFVIMSATIDSDSLSSGSLGGVINTISTGMGASPSVSDFGAHGATVTSFYAYKITSPTVFYALAIQSSGSSQSVKWNFGVFRLA